MKIISGTQFLLLKSGKTAFDQMMDKAIARLSDEGKVIIELLDDGECVITLTKTGRARAYTMLEQ